MLSMLLGLLLELALQGLWHLWWRGAGHAEVDLQES